MISLPIYSPIGSLNSRIGNVIIKKYRKTEWQGFCLQRQNTPAVLRISDISICQHPDYCTDQIETSTSPPPPPRANPGHLNFWRLDRSSFKFPLLWAKMLFKCPTLSSHFVYQMPLLKNNRRRFLTSVIKLVYIRGTQRHQFKRESYFRRGLRGTLYALRTRNKYFNNRVLKRILYSRCCGSYRRNTNVHLLYMYWSKHFDSRNTYLWHPWQVLRVTGSTENPE